MVAGPFFNQVLGYKSAWLRPWVMYAGMSLDLCVPEFVVVQGTNREPIDRYAALGFASKWEAPKAVRRLSSMGEVIEQGQAICETLPQATRLHAEVFCAVRTGWQTTMSGEEDLCQSKPDRKKKRAK